jgi:hypothetical protein
VASASRSAALLYCFGIVAIFALEVHAAQSGRRAAPQSAASLRIVLKAVARPGFRFTEAGFARSVAIMWARLRWSSRSRSSVAPHQLYLRPAQLEASRSSVPEGCFAYEPGSCLLTRSSSVRTPRRDRHEGGPGADAMPASASSAAIPTTSARHFGPISASSYSAS